MKTIQKFSSIVKHPIPTKKSQRYVSLQIAKEAKKSGFNWHCSTFFFNVEKDKFDFYTNKKKTNFNKLGYLFISCPSTQRIISWIASKGLKINIHLGYDDNKRQLYGFMITDVDSRCRFYKPKYYGSRLAMRNAFLKCFSIIKKTK